jgi:hypothetical protein
MLHLLRSAMLTTAALILVACASQQGVIDRPDWAENSVHWDGTGLSVAGHGVSDYSTTVHDEALMAEDNALHEARKLIARELAKTYVAYMTEKKETVSEEDAAYQLEKQLDNVMARQRHYDEQRRVYFIQLYMPTYRIQELIKTVFGIDVKVGNDGKFK